MSLSIHYWWNLFRLFLTTPSAQDWEDFYRAIPAGQIPWEPRQISPWIKSQLAAGYLKSPVLDVGCGFGVHSRWLADAGYQVTGVDLSAFAINRARESTGHRNNPEYQVVDVRSMPFDDRCFNTIIDRGTYHHQGRHKITYLRELRRVIQSGGHLILLAFSSRFPNPRRVTPRELEKNTHGLFKLEATGQEIHIQPDGLKIPLLTARLTAI